MTFEIFLALLTAFSIFTSLFVEAIKTSLASSKKQWASNLLVLWVSVVVGGVGTAFFYLCNDIKFTAINIIIIILMICANWLVAMLGYDKVMQAIKQMKGGK